MKIRAQIAMVLNLDKCIGCHTCSVTCKNVWTSREGMEYAWFNNVETKPGIGYPKDWENQKRWNGGWKRKKNGKIEPRIGSKWRILANIFANPDLPEIDDYYEPFTFDYQHDNEDFIRLVMNENIHRAEFLAQSKTVQQLNVTAIDSLRKLYERGVKAKVFRQDALVPGAIDQITRADFFA